MKVFLLAHQDDEVFLLPHIMDTEQKLFIYLTNGVSVGTPQLKLERRSREANVVFQKYLAGFNAQVNWWGLINSVPEGELHKNVSKKNLASIEKVIRIQSERVTQIITTTFEGAHQDHDSAAVISRRLATLFDVPIIEMSTYPQWFSNFYSFKVLNPQVPQEIFKSRRIGTLALAIKLILGYKTQRNTWLGLGLATLGAFAFRRYKSSNPAPISEIHPCFYEFRSRALQSEVLKYLT